MKILIRVLLLSSLIFVFFSTAFAADINELNQVDVVSVKSKYFKSDMEFNVTLPNSYQKKSSKKYFVLIDFQWRSQPYLSGMHDWLSHNGGWPWMETLIVTPKNNNAEFSKLFESINDDSDGGGKLLEFIENDVLASIDAKYRTNGFRIINGFRGTAALGLYTLFNKPELFNAYIIASPNLANNFAKLTSHAPEKLQKLNDKPRFLFLSSGKHKYEQTDQPSFKELEKNLKEYAPEQLNWHVKHFDEHYFMSQPIIAALQGIETLFSDIHNDLEPDSIVSSQGAEAIFKYYQYLSDKKYGFEVSAEGSLKKLGLSLLKQDPNKALSILKFSIQKYSDSAYAYQALASAYAQLNKFGQAVKYQLIAVEKSKSLIEWHQKKHKKYLDDYQSKLTESPGE